MNEMKNIFGRVVAENIREVEAALKAGYKIIGHCGYQQGEGLPAIVKRVVEAPVEDFAQISSLSLKNYELALHGEKLVLLSWTFNENNPEEIIEKVKQYME